MTVIMAESRRRDGDDDSRNVTTAGTRPQDAECLDATSSVQDKVLETSKVLKVDSSVQDEVLVYRSTRLDNANSMTNLSIVSGVSLDRLPI